MNQIAAFATSSVLILCVPAAAQLSGWQFVGGVGPPSRAQHGMAFDAARQRTVLFGGMSSTSPFPFGDTWEFDGTTWNQKSPPVSPSARARHSMVYDAVRGRVILFGGDSLPFGGGYRNETWEWDGTTWIQLSPLVFPLNRGTTSMAFDNGRSRVVLWGAGFTCDETWEWDGSTWIYRVPLTTRPPQGGAIEFDSARFVTVLVNRAGTWEWNGGDWSKRVLAMSAPPRDADALAFCPWTGSTLMFGGIEYGVGTWLGDTWAWNGAAWKSMGTFYSPTARCSHRLVTDTVRQRVIMFGGALSLPGTPFSGDTFEYVTPVQAAFAAFGSGCPGTAGVPFVTAWGTSLPWVASTFSVGIWNVPMGMSASPLLSIGASSTAWGPRSLPFDLSLIGMPGCRVLCSVDVVMQLTNLGGYARADIGLPTNLGLVGSKFFVQGIVLNDPLANALGATVSNAGQATIGVR